MKLWKRDRDKALFLTHTPESIKPGDIYDGRWADGKTYRITRLVAQTPTLMLNGGRVPCFEVYGELTEEA